MNAQLRRLDETAEILTAMYQAGRVSEARYLAAIRKLTDKAAAILNRTK